MCIICIMYMYIYVSLQNLYWTELIFEFLTNLLINQSKFAFCLLQNNPLLQWYNDQVGSVVPRMNVVSRLMREGIISNGTETKFRLIH